MINDPATLVFMAVLGLMIGSFLNVMIHRLPIMIEQSWQDSDHTPLLNLAWPGSHCPLCKHPIAWYDNIPIVSWIVLRAKCACVDAVAIARAGFPGNTPWWNC